MAIKTEINEKLQNGTLQAVHPQTDADIVSYDNTSSGLTATNVQDAIDEVLTEGGKVQDVQDVSGNTIVNSTTKIATLSKAAVGLGNVANTGDSATPTENGTTKFTTGGAYTLQQTIYSSAVGSVELSVNSSTYVVTLQSKDMNGNNLGNAETIDLPLESVVVSGTYDSATQEVVLTLQSGSTIRFSVADLVSGLQTEITSTNKLSSDLVDDTGHTNKFVTASEKSQIGTNQTNIGTLQGYFTNGVANEAAKVSNALTFGSKTYDGSVAREVTAADLGAITENQTITISGDASGSGKTAITLTLANTGVTAGTYSAVQVDAKGRATAGGQIIEVGEANQTTPSASLVVGGLFFKRID